MYKGIHPTNKWKYLVPLIVVVGLALAVGSYLFVRYKSNQSNTPVTTPSGVKLEPATEEEKNEADQNKEELSKPPSTPTTLPNGKKEVSVIISSASADLVTAYVSGVFEEGGVCTATFTQGSTSITRTSTGMQNVSYTQCKPITPSLPNSSPWSVTVSYESSTASGKSQPQGF